MGTALTPTRLVSTSLSRGRTSHARNSSGPGLRRALVAGLGGCRERARALWGSPQNQPHNPLCLPLLILSDLVLFPWEQQQTLLTQCRPTRFFSTQRQGSGQLLLQPQCLRVRSRERRNAAGPGACEGFGQSLGKERDHGSDKGMGWQEGPER